jgi:deazaflavin-dependent oxidoreductase (nitroreductase family)
MSTSPQDFNAQVIDEFRSTGGVVGGPFAAMPLLLLHHTGARSGTSRTTPLAYLRDDDRYVIFASKAGAATNPDWYHNLKAHPRTTIEVGRETIEVTAEDANGEERDRLFRAQVARSPAFGEYAAKTGGRVIPVIVLTPAA